MTGLGLTMQYITNVKKSGRFKGENKALVLKMLKAIELAIITNEASENVVLDGVSKTVCENCNHVDVGTFEDLNHCFVCEHEWKTVC